MDDLEHCSFLPVEKHEVEDAHQEVVLWLHYRDGVHLS